MSQQKTTFLDAAIKVIDYGHESGKDKSEWNSSPNNIKTLIISPDGIAVRLFLGAMQRQFLSSLKYSEGSPAPIVSILAKPRVCKNIEEIVFVVNSSERSITLSESEYDCSSLLVGWTGSGWDAVKSRYPRLKQIVIINNIVFSAVLSLPNEKNKFYSDIFKDSGLAGQYKVINVNSDWWKKAETTGYGSAMENGIDERLRNYFSKDLQKRQELNKQSKIQERTQERLGSTIDEYKTLRSVVDTQWKLLRYLKSSEYNSFANTEVISRIKPITIKAVKSCGDKVTDKPKFTNIVESESSDSETIKINIDSLQKFILSNYKIVCHFILSSLTDDLNKGTAIACGLYKDVDFKVIGGSETDNKIYTVDFAEKFNDSAKHYIDKLFITSKEA